MKRYDTFTPEVKQAFEITLVSARLYGKTIFNCLEADSFFNCQKCPMYKLGNGFTSTCAYKPKTANEWLAWANEEVCSEEN